MTQAIGRVGANTLSKAQAEKRFDKMDQNKDGKLSLDEKPQRGKKGKGKDDKKGKENGKKNAE